jgi:predicted nucleotidyltransferase
MNELADSFNYLSARRRLQRKQEEITERRFQLWQQAEEEANKIINMIINKYQPQRIIQWGSVVDSKYFSEISDIDIAIVGVDSVTFLQILADAEAITRFSLDLIRWENIDPSFQNIILMKGKIIYER